jgi:transcriptional regulator with XRE-family HTH domain
MRRSQEVKEMKPLSQVRKTRLLAGITLDEIGAQTGLDQSYLSRLERGLYRPSFQAAEKIARALNCAVGDLWPDLEPATGQREKASA